MQNKRFSTSSSGGKTLSTLYFGGGTPSFFGAEGLAVILSVIRKSFDVAHSAEITFEANPDSINDKLVPLEGHVSTTGCSEEETIRRAKEGV